MQRGIKRFIWCAVWLSVLTGTTFAGDAPAAVFPGKAGTFPDEKIAVGNETREYRLVVPDSIDLSKFAPIVFAFHGMGEDNKDHYAAISGLPELAAEHKFILVFPAAAVQTVQGQAVKAWAFTPEQATADIQFFDALLAKLRAQYRIDPDAIYITGMSNGAYFAHLITRERPNVIAAVAAHSGELGDIDLGNILTARPFPVMIIHGDADPVFNVSLARSARAMYQAAGHPVTYIEIPGWVHAWDKAMDEKIWDFFSAHRLHPTQPAQTASPAASAAATPKSPAAQAAAASAANGTLPAH